LTLADDKFSKDTFYISLQYNSVIFLRVSFHDRRIVYHTIQRIRKKSTFLESINIFLEK